MLAFQSGSGFEICLVRGVGESIWEADSLESGLRRRLGVSTFLSSVSLVLSSW